MLNRIYRPVSTLPLTRSELLRNSSTDSDIRQVMITLEAKNLIGSRTRERMEDMLISDNRQSLIEWIRELQLKERT